MFRERVDDLVDRFGGQGKGLGLDYGVLLNRVGREGIFPFSVLQRPHVPPEPP